MTPVPQRILALKEELFATETSFCFERAQLVTESYKATDGQPTVLRRAQALYFE
ncbi:MAG: pyruvate formate lyase family protein [Anaerolineae bacterium]|nr:pyruvate formate lyase family protein [Anaerolineae bacterium]